MNDIPSLAPRLYIQAARLRHRLAAAMNAAVEVDDYERNVRIYRAWYRSNQRCLRRHRRYIA